MKTVQLAHVAMALAISMTVTMAHAQAHAGTPATAPPQPQAAAQAAAMHMAPMKPAGPPSAAGEAQRGYAAVKGNILKSAEEMPAEDYSFKPTPDIRTFARVVNHVAEAQFHTCSAVNGTAPSALPKLPEETAPKEEIVAALKESFAACDKAYASLTDENLTEMFSAGPAGKRSRIGLMWGNVSHNNEQYATLALYMRLKDLVPPSSEK